MTGINSVNEILDVTHIKLSLSKPYVCCCCFVFCKNTTKACHKKSKTLKINDLVSLPF